MYIHEHEIEKRGRVKFYDPHHTFYDPKTNPELRKTLATGASSYKRRVFYTDSYKNRF